MSRRFTGRNRSERASSNLWPIAASIGVHSQHVRPAERWSTYVADRSADRCSLQPVYPADRSTTLMSTLQEDIIAVSRCHRQESLEHLLW